MRVYQLMKALGKLVEADAAVLNASVYMRFDDAWKQITTSPHCVEAVNSKRLYNMNLDSMEEFADLTVLLS